MRRAVTGEVVGLWFHALKAHDRIGRRGTTIGVGTRQGGSLASAECRYGPDRVGWLWFRADGVDVLKYASWGTGVDDASFHRDEFVRGATEFLFSKSEAMEGSGVAVEEGLVTGDFGSYAWVA
jgi:hypothetical protein